MATKAELQHLRALREKKEREAAGLFVVEGEKVVGELIKAGFLFEKIYATDTWSSPSADVVVLRLTAAEMERATHFPTPSTVLAVGKIPHPNLPPDALNHGLTLALDGVQDPGNVGTLLRVADWFALDRVLLSLDCADLFHQKVINASMGSFARVRAHRVPLASTLADARAPVLGCVLDGEDVHALSPLTNAIVVIGSEGRGLSPAVAERVTQRVTIPRLGQAESLNAGVAAAIVCDNLRRLAPPRA